MIGISLRYTIPKTMAGLYIHVPFCVKRCLYCDFYSNTDMALKKLYVDAVCKELKLKKDFLKAEPVRTIYFGGGTPSQLPAEDFRRIFHSIEEYFDISECEEITLEANPDDITKEYLGSLKTLPFNRISMGVQSFQQKDLDFLNRRHNKEQAAKAIRYCREYGYNNISIDLIYGLPNQTKQEWEENLREAISLNVPHISAYHIIYEEGTALYKLKEAGSILPVDEELSVTFFSTLIDMLTEAGYHHYEISNFAKPNCYSKHNSSYWNATKYLGIGPSAHSFDGDCRVWNKSSIKDYINGIQNNTSITETEPLDEKTKYNEYIITGLRTMWGIKISEVEQLFGKAKADFLKKQSNDLIKNGLLLQDGDNIVLSKDGIFISDSIMSDLLYT
jgi:putative oxygen-independent coproporphyrinogen III oxidase